MRSSTRDERIKFLESALEQRDNIKYNIKAFTGIIDILIRDIGFPKQNKLLKSLKTQLNKERLDLEEIDNLMKQIKVINE